MKDWDRTLSPAQAKQLRKHTLVRAVEFGIAHGLVHPVETELYRADQAYNTMSEASRHRLLIAICNASADRLNRGER